MTSGDLLDENNAMKPGFRLLGRILLADALSIIIAFTVGFGVHALLPSPDLYSNPWTDLGNFLVAGALGVLILPIALIILLIALIGKAPHRGAMIFTHLGAIIFLVLLFFSFAERISFASIPLMLLPALLSVVVARTDRQASMVKILVSVLALSVILGTVSTLNYNKRLEEMRQDLVGQLEESGVNFYVPSQGKTSPLPDWEFLQAEGPNEFSPESWRMQWRKYLPDREVNYVVEHSSYEYKKCPKTFIPQKGTPTPANQPEPACVVVGESERFGKVVEVRSSGEYYVMDEGTQITIRGDLEDSEVITVLDDLIRVDLQVWEEKLN